MWRYMMKQLLHKEDRRVWRVMLDPTLQAYSSDFFKMVTERHETVCQTCPTGSSDTVYTNYTVRILSSLEKEFTSFQFILKLPAASTCYCTIPLHSDRSCPFLPTCALKYISFSCVSILLRHWTRLLSKPADPILKQCRWNCVLGKLFPELSINNFSLL